MISGSQRSKRRNVALSTLDGVIQVLSVAKDTCGVPPAQIALGSACVLLNTIKDTMGNKDDYVDLGMTCGEVCKVLDQGLQEIESDELSRTVIDAIERLKATMNVIQGRIVEKNERNVLSRAFSAKGDKEEIVAWKQEFKTILEIFNTELHIGVLVGVKRLHRDLLANNRQYPALASILGELPPPAPKAFFGRDNVVEELVALAEGFRPIAIIGAGGSGKTSIALALLHHDRIKNRFKDDRRFIRCDGFTPSLPNFLARLSKAIGAGIENPEDLGSLRPFLSSKKLFIVFDNGESIFDPEGTDSQEILAVVNELCQFEKISVCITSRITTVPQHCKRPKLQTLSMEAACDIFYSIYDARERSSTIQDLMQRLEFHPLSITLLATTASQNQWDYNRLAKEWAKRRAQVLQIHSESLAATITLSLDSPTFLKLGPEARDLLGIIAFFPQGINENNLDWLFPAFPDIESILDKFCALSLTYRNDGHITMLAPIRDHLGPRDPTSSPLLCMTKDHYFTRLSVDLYPGKPGFEEAQWIVSEDVNVEHLLNVFTSIDSNGVDVWNLCGHFAEHLCWYKSRKTILAPKIEDLPDDHPSKPECLFQLSEVLGSVGNGTERKRLLSRALELEKERGNRPRISRALRRLSDANRLLGHLEEGIKQAEGALEIFEVLGDPTEQPETLSHLGFILYEDGQLDAAENAAFRAINLVPEKGQEYPPCQPHRLLGDIYQSKGQKEKAIHHYHNAIGIASRLKWHCELYCNHFSLAGLLCFEEEFDRANTHVELAKSHSVNNVFDLGNAILMQAFIWHRQHKLEDARVEVLCALEIFEKLGATKEAEICRTFFRELNETVDQSSANEVHPPATWRMRLRMRLGRVYHGSG